MSSRRTVLATLAGLGVHGFAPAAPAGPMHRAQHLFGGPAELLLAHGDEGAANAVFALLQQINARWNAWKPGELTTLNTALRSGQAAAVAPPLAQAIRGAARLEAASGGFFNPAIGAAVGGWGFHDDVLRPGTAPARARIARWAGERPSLAQLEWRGGLVRSRNPALQIDLGAYAKGLAADRALELLQARGVGDAIVNLGGNLAAMGQGSAGPWRVGIRDPFSPGLVASLQTRGREAVVTSGSYERYRLLDGECCSHVLDPWSATPARGLVSATVVHPSAALADAAATALLVAGRARWRALAERMGVREALVLDARGDGEASAALAARLQFASAAWRRALTVA